MILAASNDLIVWLIIAIVGIVKYLSSVKQAEADGETEVPEAPRPVAGPVSRPVRLPPAIPRAVAAPPVATPKPSPAPEPAPAPVHKPAPPAPEPATRTSQWAAALRDRSNVRNIIIASEIIGPPKSS